MWRSVFSCSAPVNTVCSHVLALPPVNTVWLPLGLKSTTPWMPRLPRPLPPKRAMSVSTPDLETAHGPRVVILRESMDDFVRRFCKGPRTKDIKSHTVCRNRLCSFRNFSYFPLSKPVSEFSCGCCTPLSSGKTRILQEGTPTSALLQQLSIQGSWNIAYICFYNIAYQAALLEYLEL